jgi:hypothetical protein
MPSPGSVLEGTRTRTWHSYSRSFEFNRVGCFVFEDDKNTDVVGFEFFGLLERIKQLI